MWNRRVVNNKGVKGKLHLAEPAFNISFYNWVEGMKRTPVKVTVEFEDGTKVELEKGGL